MVSERDQIGMALRMASLGSFVLRPPSPPARTETVEKTEYIEMMQRLIRGATDLQSDGSLRWKDDEKIEFDSFFSVSGEDEKEAKLRFEGKRHKEDNKNTVLAGYGTGGGDDGDESGVSGSGYGKGAKPKKGGKRRRGARRQSAMPMLPPEKVKVMIARLYEAKLVADDWLKG